MLRSIRIMEAQRNLTSMIQFFTSHSVPFGRTYGSWTTKWWQWALSTPRSVNPVVDSTGIYAHKHQSGDAWYLAGKFGSEDRSLPERKCSIPREKGILFPILNCEANPLEYPNLKTDEDLIHHVNKDVDTVVLRDCFVNGERIPPQRIRSDPRVFDLSIHRDNPLGVKGGGFTRAAADGYWVFLKPLAVGVYSIEFEGRCENGRLCSGARYNITVS
jgi:hypothetical protein